MIINDLSPIPLYRQMAEIIRGEIRSGRLKKGERLVSHKELARQHGVSLITVKRALNELIRDGLLYSRVGKGTYVSGMAARVELSEHRAIGLVLSDLKSPFFSLVMHSVEEHASHYGFSLLLSNSSEQIDKEERQIGNFRAMGVSGLIIASMTHEGNAGRALRDLHDSGFPYVMVSYLRDTDMYFVGTDHEQGGYVATRHLIAMGYTRIGYINGESGNLVGELRRSGYRRALAESSLAATEAWEFRLRRRGEWFDYGSGYEIGARFARSARRPEAMFVYNDLAALGFEQAVLDAGLSVPRDVAIVGFDGIERGEYAPVPLTTIRQATGAIGERAVALLRARIEGGPADVKTVLSGELIVRQSCGAQRGAGTPSPGASPSA
jgi:DNA-binding LacI/PurR family transcriptional regulator